MATLVENVVRIVNAFKSIKSAIILKGVTPTGGVDTYAQAIKDIDGGIDVSDTTAQRSDVKTGKYFYNNEGIRVEGIAVDGGYDISGTTATKSDVMYPKYFYTVNGTKTQGTVKLQDCGGVTYADLIASKSTTHYINPDSGYSAIKKVGCAYPSPATVYNTPKVNIKSTKSTFPVEYAVTSSDPSTIPLGLVNESEIDIHGENGSTITNPANVIMKGCKVVARWNAEVDDGVANATMTGTVGRSKYGTVTTSSGSTSTVTLGWKPSYVMVLRNRSSSNTMANMYYNGTYLNISTATSSASTSNLITVTSTGFTISANGTYYGTCYYMAIE